MPPKGWKKNASGVWEAPADIEESGMPEQEPVEEQVQAPEVAPDPPAPPADPDDEPVVYPICALCWPLGWPHPTCVDAECVHGHWHQGAVDEVP